MTSSRKATGLTPLIISSALFFLGAYFTFTAVQGDYGIFRRVQVDAEITDLRAELDALEAEVTRMRTATRRMSDDFLDIHLLDQQARDVLGLMRTDEILIR